MAQTGQAQAIAPNATVTIYADGKVDKPEITIPNHGIVEFRSETTRAWEVELVDSDSGGFYPLAIIVPGIGAAYFIGNAQTLSDTVEYTIVSLLGNTPPVKGKRVMTNNRIIIGDGGEGRGKSKRRK
jgi:hypothetical protein